MLIFGKHRCPTFCAIDTGIGLTYAEGPRIKAHADDDFGGPECPFGLSLDTRNLRAFDAETGHQPLLIENEGIGIVFQGR